MKWTQISFTAKLKKKKTCFSFTLCYNAFSLIKNIPRVLSWFFYAYLRNHLISRVNHSAVQKSWVDRALSSRWSCHISQLYLQPKVFFIHFFHFTTLLHKVPINKMQVCVFNQGIIMVLQSTGRVTINCLNLWFEEVIRITLDQSYKVKLLFFGLDRKPQVFVPPSLSAHLSEREPDEEIKSNCEKIAVHLQVIIYRTTVNNVKKTNVEWR